MRFLRDLLLRRKLMLVMMLSSSVTLLVACLAWFWGDWRSSHESQSRQLTLLAEIIGVSVTPALEFGDRETAASDLLMLARRPSIRRAAVYDVAGNPIASYSARPAGEVGQLEFLVEGERMRRGTLSVYVPILVGERRIGTVGIEADSSEILARQIEFARSVLVVLVVCVVLALGLSYRMQRFISEPVLRLADTARAVSTRKDYSLRAERIGRDELGDLTDTFNAMLAAIQERDLQLEESRATLEEQVAARTRELTAKNESLQVSMEEARAASLAKAQFLANMSHEIRTPMNGILGMNELLLDSPLDERQKSYAEIVKSSAESLLEVINDILDFSKIEAGKLTLERVEFDLHRTVEEVVGLLSGTARKRGLELTCSIPPSVPRAIRGDPTRLRQVLTNLVGNAIKFTERGHVAVRLACDPGPGSEQTVRFEVEDTGIGIPAPRQEQLFQPFSQVDASTTRRYGGTGLGLAISKQLVELMQGNIGLESEPGRGSTFWFSVTVETLSAGPSGACPLPAGCPRPRALVADASAAAREMLRRQLTAWGIEHELVASARQVLEVLRDTGASKRIGLLLIDSELCANEELAAYLGSLDPLRRPRVIALAWAGMPVGPAAGACEPVATLVKPVRPSRLFDVLVGSIDEDRVLRSEPEKELRTIRNQPSEAGALSVLLAEDNAINQIVARKILARGGFDCDIVSDGRQAVEAVRSRAYDVVLMDCQMPLLDGFEATGLIRALEREVGRARPAHVIALTANAMKGDRELCLAAGMDDYLSKPVKPELLLSKLGQLARSLSEPHRLPEASEPLDVAALVARFAHRPGELTTALAELEPVRRSLFARLENSLHEADAEASMARLSELHASTAWLESKRIDQLARELESFCGRGQFLEATLVLETIASELDRCLALAPAVEGRSGAA